MTKVLHPTTAGGSIDAIASKSVAHRLLICAAFADNPTTITCQQVNEDILATARCLQALGARIDRRENEFVVVPIQKPTQNAVLDCGESGSTLRFLLPVVAALGCHADFVMQGRLPQRPLSPLREELERHGITLSTSGSNPLRCAGKLCAGEYRIAGNVSSQFISGLFFALSLLDEESTLCIDGKLESAPYVDMTLDALSIFGINPRTENGIYHIGGKSLRSPSVLAVEGDWSNAAFPLCMGAIGKESVTVCHLNLQSHQGDRAILDILRRFGASVIEGDSSVTVCGGELHGIELDASQIPDLVPVLAVVATSAYGKTVISGAERLRLKESDRLESVCALLSALGGAIQQTKDGLIINGCGKLQGGKADAFGDHRIAMSAAVASLLCQSPVTLTGAESVAKSYPSFWSDFDMLCSKKKI